MQQNNIKQWFSTSLFSGNSFWRHWKISHAFASRIPCLTVICIHLSVAAVDKPVLWLSDGFMDISIFCASCYTHIARSYMILYSTVHCIFLHVHRYGSRVSAERWRCRWWWQCWPLCTVSNQCTSMAPDVFRSGQWRFACRRWSLVCIWWYIILLLLSLWIQRGFLVGF